MSSNQIETPETLSPAPLAINFALDVPRGIDDWRPADLVAEYNSLDKNDWLLPIANAIQGTVLGSEHLCAVSSQETGPYWAGHPDGQIIGDHGDAIGPMQLNKNSIVDAFAHADPAANFLKGAQILDALWRQLLSKNLDISDILLLQTFYAAYNRGLDGALANLTATGNPDLGPNVTARGRYGLACMQRQSVLGYIISQSNFPNGPALIETPATSTPAASDDSTAPAAGPASGGPDPQLASAPETSATEPGASTTDAAPSSAT
ncbi:MAG TPA: hypothetical protein VI756_15370 [Blastocatellia bacterium]